MDHTRTREGHEYRIKTTDGRDWPTTYPTQQDAAEAIAEAYGWDEAIMSERYTVMDGRDETSAVSAYATRDDCDEDQDGAQAPRIVRIPPTRKDGDDNGD